MWFQKSEAYDAMEKRVKTSVGGKCAINKHNDHIKLWELCISVINNCNNVIISTAYFIIGEVFRHICKYILWGMVEKFFLYR